MDREDIINFLKAEVEPVPDQAYGPGYRASVLLEDGTFLPCVMFRNPEMITDLALRRFEQEKSGKSIFGGSKEAAYRNIVRHFITTGNRISDYQIAKVLPCRWAFPYEFLGEIDGETTMGWTAFSVRMKDGKHFSFGTSFRWEFFSMPEGYSGEDFAELIPHSYVRPSGELGYFRRASVSDPDEYDHARVFRERPFFECFLQGL